MKKIPIISINEVINFDSDNCEIQGKWELEDRYHDLAMILKSKGYEILQFTNNWGEYSGLIYTLIVKQPKTEMLIGITYGSDYESTEEIKELYTIENEMIMSWEAEEEISVAYVPKAG